MAVSSSYFLAVMLSKQGPCFTRLECSLGKGIVSLSHQGGAVRAELASPAPESEDHSQPADVIVGPRVPISKAEFFPRAVGRGPTS